MTAVGGMRLRFWCVRDARVGGLRRPRHGRRTAGGRPGAASPCDHEAVAPPVTGRRASDTLRHRRARAPRSVQGAETDARRRGDTARLLRAARRARRAVPRRSHEAQVSRMMVARLLLNRGDAAGALSGFDAYLRGGGGELPRGRAGRASHRPRADGTGAAKSRRAWMTLLDQFPNTAYGAHARSQVEAPSEN